MPIQLLSERVIAQIAAGEVVERPSSVIKEMLENALDAGARNIHVAAQDGGRRLMRITDDGHGILSEEVQLAFARHATSKLRTADDLFNIGTLGFRGEALASIAAVSHTTMTTRHRDEQIGVRVRYEGGQLAYIQPTGGPAGTVISVENLFFNTPARLKFLKSDSTEKRQISTIVTRYAMAYPNVRFTLEQDGVEMFRAHGSGSLADVLVGVLGVDDFRQMIEIDSDYGDDGVRIYGFTSAPDFSRADRSRIVVFVNGRWVQDNSLTYAVTQAYHTLLMNGRHPVSVLMIQVPPDDVDVNVHPTKAEVRFRNPNAIFGALQRSVRRAVLDAASAPSIRIYSNPPNTPPQQLSMNEYVVDSGQYAHQQHTQLPNADTQADDTDSAAASPANHGGLPTITDLAAEHLTAIPQGIGAPQRPRTLPPLRIVGQIGSSYIIAEGPAGLYLIDQHAAHERVLYEQFMEDYQRQGRIAQYALGMQTISVPPSDAQLLEANLQGLANIGFTLEPFGPNTFAIRSVPAILSDAAPQEVLQQILSDLDEGKAPAQQSIEDRIIKRVCKRAAVKAGQILSLDAMQGIIRQLERCRNPHTCPHGRPTLMHLSRDQLAREFGRMG